MFCGIHFICVHLTLTERKCKLNKLYYSQNRTYTESVWCMKEFREAHAHATGNGRNKFLIPVLFGDVGVKDLDADLKFHLENHTYIQSNKMVNRYTFLQKKGKIHSGMTF